MAAEFSHPKIEKRANLLAEIGSMAETREFITLQRVARSGEKKLPRRLGFAEWIRIRNASHVYKPDSEDLVYAAAARAGHAKRKDRM